MSEGGERDRNGTREPNQPSERILPSIDREEHERSIPTLPGDKELGIDREADRDFPELPGDRDGNDKDIPA